MQSRGPDIADAHFNDLSLRLLQSRPSTDKSTLAFATVLGDMLLQAGDGHGHPHCQLPLFGRRKVSEPYQPPHPTARLDKLAFEPSMFRTTYRESRSRIHHAPVENREWQISIKAKKKQTIFSPYIRLKERGVLAGRTADMRNERMVGTFRRPGLRFACSKEGLARHHSSDRPDHGR